MCDTTSWFQFYMSAKMEFKNADRYKTKNKSKYVQQATPGR